MSQTSHEELGGNQYIKDFVTNYIKDLSKSCTYTTARAWEPKPGLREVHYKGRKATEM